MTGRLVFILGGARSGKSAYAEQRAKDTGGRVLFVATAEPLDDDMRARILRHRGGRPETWDTLEAPRNVGRHIGDMFHMRSYDCGIVDCITLLVSNVLMRLPEDADETQAEAAVMGEIAPLLAALAAVDAEWLVVSNEVGLGIVPPTPLGRVYRDALGRANQRIARAADEVILMVAGLPWHLKK